MGIIMFIIFLITDLSMVGIFAFLYRGKEQYCEGMILGVHISKTEENDEEVQYLCKKYKKNLKKINFWNFIIGSLVCFLCFLNFTAFMIIWMIWLVVYLVMSIGFINISHRKMYDIKIKNNWMIEGNTHIVHIDTIVSSMTKKLPLSPWWNLLAVVCIITFQFIPQIKDYTGANTARWIIPGVTLFITFLFWGLHLWVVHRKNIVYSGESSVNMAINRLEKRTWSGILLAVNFMNVLSWTYLAIKIIVNQWLYDTDYWIYISLQMIPVVIIILGVVYMQNKRIEVLSMDTAALVVDDDEYWKNGWYNNPNDAHLLVQDRMCSTNYTMNMAKPAAKVITAATAVFITAAVAIVFSLILSLENTKITFLMDGNQVTIDASMYDTDFNINEIQTVKILAKLPEDDFTRTNGGATEKILVGHFEGKETGKCLMYLYRDYVPILEIKLKEQTIYINSKDEGDVQEWYEELAE